MVNKLTINSLPVNDRPKNLRGSKDRDNEYLLRLKRANPGVEMASISDVIDRLNDNEDLNDLSLQEKNEIKFSHPEAKYIVNKAKEISNIPSSTVITIGAETLAKYGFIPEDNSIKVIKSGAEAIKSDFKDVFDPIVGRKPDEKIKKKSIADTFFKAVGAIGTGFAAKLMKESAVGTLLANPEVFNATTSLASNLITNSIGLSNHSTATLLHEASLAGNGYSKIAKMAIPKALSFVPGVGPILAPLADFGLGFFT